MSSGKNPAWTTPVMIILVGGLAFYAMSRGPSCPANTSRSASRTSAASPTAVNTDAKLVHADESNFDEVVLGAAGPVLVDFYADWCGPCQMLAPVLERVAEDLTEGRIVKVDVDDNPRIAARYNIQALPTLLVFRDGQIVDKVMGFQEESGLRQLLQQ